MIAPTPTGISIDFTKGNVIYEINAEGYITYINRSFLTVSQYRKEDVIGAHYWSVAFVSPKVDEAGNTTGYTSMYKAMNEIAIEEMSSTYEKIYLLEQEGKETRGLIKNIHIA